MERMPALANLPLHVPIGVAPVYALCDGQGHEHAFRFLVSKAQTGGSYSTMMVV